MRARSMAASRFPRRSRGGMQGPGPRDPEWPGSRHHPGLGGRRPPHRQSAPSRTQRAGRRSRFTGGETPTVKVNRLPCARCRFTLRIGARTCIPIAATRPASGRPSSDSSNLARCTSPNPRDPVVRTRHRGTAGARNPLCPPASSHSPSTLPDNQEIRGTLLRESSR